jgi:hypothetical protein
MSIYNALQVGFMHCKKGFFLYNAEDDLPVLLEPWPTIMNGPSAGKNLEKKQIQILFKKM